MGSIYFSDTIQNEVIQQFDQSVQPEIVSHAVKCSFYGQADDGSNSCLYNGAIFTQPADKTANVFSCHFLYFPTFRLIFSWSLFPLAYHFWVQLRLGIHYAALMQIEIRTFELFLIRLRQFSVCIANVKWCAILCIQKWVGFMT